MQATAEQRDRLAQAHFIQAGKHAKAGEFYAAARQFRRAAMLGHARAMYYLGMQFLRGRGMPRSDYHAHCWLSLAAQAGVNDAELGLHESRDQLTSREQILAQRLAADRFEQINDLDTGLFYEDQSFTL